MKKKVLASLLCASMVATMFAGCGSDNGGNGTEKADKKAGGKETITVMGPSEDLDDAQGAWLKTECEAFAKANPDFNIEFKYVTSSESDAKDVVTKDPKAAADVYMFANDQLEPLIKADAIAKLGGDTAEYVKSSNSEAMAATVTYDGDIYAVPYTSNTWFMYYDKRVFSEDDVKSLDTMLTRVRFHSHLIMAGISMHSMQQTDVQSSETEQTRLPDMISVEIRVQQLQTTS